MIIGYATKMDDQNKTIEKQMMALNNADCDVIFVNNDGNGLDRAYNYVKTQRDWKAKIKLVIPDLSVLGLQVSNAVQSLEKFQRLNVVVYSLADNCDTTTDVGLLQMQVRMVGNEFKVNRGEPNI